MKNKSCDNQGAPRLRGARQRGVPPDAYAESGRCVSRADHLIRGIWLSVVSGLDWTASWRTASAARFRATPGRQVHALLTRGCMGTLWRLGDLAWKVNSAAAAGGARARRDLALPVGAGRGEDESSRSLSDFLRQDTVELPDKRMAETVSGRCIGKPKVVRLTRCWWMGRRWDARFASKQSFHKEQRFARRRCCGSCRSYESSEIASERTRDSKRRVSGRCGSIEGYEFIRNGEDSHHCAKRRIASRARPSLFLSSDEYPGKFC